MKKRYRKHFKWLKHKLKKFKEDNYNHVKPRGSQIYRVICGFGGVEELNQALKLVGRNHYNSTIYRWLKKGNGIFPEDVLEDVIYVSRFVGVLLTQEDVDPRVQISDEEAEAYHETMGVYKSVHVPKEVKEERKAALLKELYEKEKAGRIKTEAQLLEERKDFVARYRRMHDAARKHFEEKRGNETDE